MNRSLVNNRPSGHGSLPSFQQAPEHWGERHRFLGSLLQSQSPIPSKLRQGYPLGSCLTLQSRCSLSCSFSPSKESLKSWQASPSASRYGRERGLGVNRLLCAHRCLEAPLKSRRWILLARHACYGLIHGTEAGKQNRNYGDLRRDRARYPRL